MRRRWILAALIVVGTVLLGGYAFARPGTGPKSSAARHGWFSYAQSVTPSPFAAVNSPRSRARAGPGAPGSGVSGRWTARAQRQCPHKPLDPRTALPLPPDALGGASEAALRYFRSVHGGVAGVRGAIVQTATRQPPPARATARSMCGAQIARRSVLVNVSLPEPHGLNSASLSFGIVLVSRFASGYRAWFQLH